MIALQGASPRLGTTQGINPAQGGSPILPGQYPAPYTPVYAQQTAPFDLSAIIEPMMMIMVMGMMMSMMKGVMGQVA